MTIQLIFFEIAIGIIALGAVLAYKRSLGERVCLFGAVVISYLAAFLLTKLGKFDGIADFVVGLLSTIEGIDSIMDASPLLLSGTGALIAALIRPFIMTFVFLLFCIVLRIIIAIVIKVARLEEKTDFFRAEKGEKTWKKVATCVVGALTCYALFMLSYLPLASLENLAKPAIDTVKAEQYNGTYIQGTASIADEFLLPTGSKTAFGTLQKCTGFEAILKGTCKSLADVTATDGNGSEVAFNSTELLQDMLRCGAEAAALYEFTCHPDDYTLGNMKASADIVDTVAKHEILLRMVGEYLQASGKDAKPAEDGDIAKQLLAMISEGYSKENASGLKNDLGVISALLTTVFTDLDEVNLREEDLLPALFDYMEKQENAYKVVNTLSQMNTYEAAFDMLAEYGVGVLCEKLSISENQQGYYENYLDSIYAEVNKRTDGDYYVEEVDTFIRYAIENGLDVSSYNIADPENLTPIDFAYTNYLHYFAQSQRFEVLFANYLLDDKNASTAYTMADGSVCIFDKKENKWSFATSEEGIKAGSLAAQLLAIEVKTIFAENIEITITKDDIKLISTEIILRLEEEGAVNASAERRASAAALLRTFLSVESFAPADAVYRDDILASLKKDSGFDESQNQSFASIVAAAAAFGSGIYGNEEAESSLYIDNFDLIGRLLDGLQQMEKTSAVPEKMLWAITQHKDYGKYFLADSIKELSENVNNGVSTYEELFTSVQALYNIANQVIPE